MLYLYLIIAVCFAGFAGSIPPAKNWLGNIVVGFLWPLVAVIGTTLSVIKWFTKK